MIKIWWLYIAISGADTWVEVPGYMSEAECQIAAESVVIAYELAGIPAFEVSCVWEFGNAN